MRISQAVFRGSLLLPCLQALVNGDKYVQIQAFQPLPHTGDPLEVEAARLNRFTTEAEANAALEGPAASSE